MHKKKKTKFKCTNNHNTKILTRFVYIIYKYAKLGSKELEATNNNE